jgi:hypothetical protein
MKTIVRFALGCLVYFTILPAAQAQEAVELVDATEPGRGWSFNNGAEFPGAKGSLTVDAEAPRAGRPSLKLVGDFSNGGIYVQAGRRIDDVDIRDLTLWLRAPGIDRFTLRIGDASGQTHQISVRLEPSDDWQQIVLPLERFFAKRGEADAVTNIAKYESWGGAKDGRWHGPARGIYFLLGKRAESPVRTLWLNEVSITPRPTPVAGAEQIATVRLDDIADGGHDWTFTNGPEFKGATGSLTVAEPDADVQRPYFKLAGDFANGGQYVAAVCNLTEAGVEDLDALRFRVKTSSASAMTIQLVDGTGQTHQRRGFKIRADGAWHDVVVKPQDIAGGEHWGGANDGKWHAGARQVVLSLPQYANPLAKQFEIALADLRAESIVPVFAQPPAFRATFADDDALHDWKTTADVTIERQLPFRGTGALLLARTLEQVQEPCTAVGPKFAVVPGRWEASLAARGDLHSPDNSYSGVVELELLDGADKPIERINVVDLFGKRPWQTVKKIVEVPKEATSARFTARLNKTYGRFALDELSASYLAPAAKRDDRIIRVLFDTAQLGNLLLPSDSKQVQATVEARRPLTDAQRTLKYVVRDYWGAEQTAAATVRLVDGEKLADRLQYTATLDLGQAPLAVGRYYEIHTEIAAAESEPFRAYTSLAVLPEAVTRKYAPLDVPFTARNWDNRITEYVKLVDRLGVRVCGLWGGWSSKPPYTPQAPQLELCRQLGMGWLTTTPCTSIERSGKDYDETALRTGTRNFLEKYAHERPLVINLGNEPHGTGEKVLKNVEAYRWVYEEVKKFDPTIPVVATSVEPNEEYFRAGYGKYCDAFDFHIYEDSENVRRTIGMYRELQQKYDCVKPIWSTELGLNSQGMTRHVVAVELYKKFATFFAAGGANVSWFGLLYPDPEGKSHGSSGDAHNVFDCRYRRYAPRLDAVAYYHAVNQIAIKRFVAERDYGDGLQAFLFRDKEGRALQIWWKNKGRRDVFVELPDVGEVRLTRLDGRQAMLDAGQKGLTLSVGSDPLLLEFDGAATELPDVPAGPAVRLHEPPVTMARNRPTSVFVQYSADVSVRLVAPPFWKVEPGRNSAASPTMKATRIDVTPPADSAVREGELIVELRDSAGRRSGELYHRATVAE